MKRIAPIADYDQLTGEQKRWYDKELKFVKNQDHFLHSGRKFTWKDNRRYSMWIRKYKSYICGLSSDEVKISSY